MKINIPESNDPRIVIIGAGFGGIKLAKKLKRTKCQIVLLDKNNFHTFQPLLYQVATSALEAESICYPIRKIFKGQDNFFFRQGEVKSINAEEKFIDLGKDVTLEYDYLVIATGARTNFFGNEGLMVNAMSMKNIVEAIDLRSLVLQNFEKALTLTNERKRQGLMNFVIAGAGPTGVELAGALGEMKQKILPKDYPELDLSKMNIYLVQSRDRVLPALSEKSSAKALKYLKKLGVEVVLNTRVLDYHGDYVQTNTDQDMIAKTLIWTAGVEGAPISGLNIDVISRGNRILVDSFNRVRGHDTIFAIGDVAAMETEDEPRGHPMVAPVAVQQGEQLAKNFQRVLKSEKMKPFKYKDKGSMATVGKNKAVVQIGKRNIGGFFAWFIWMLVHLLSLVGFRNRIVVLMNWMRNYFNSDRGMRLIITPFELSKAKKKRRDMYGVGLKHHITEETTNQV